MYSKDFYILNANQYFEFPHTNCDELETDYLKNLFFNGFGKYCFEYFGGKNMDDITMDTDIGDFAAAFMRMKFVAEVTDPLRLNRRLAKVRDIKGLRKGEVGEIWEWESEEGLERFHQIETLTNRICNTLFEQIRAIVGNTEKPKTHLRPIVDTLNTELRTIRKGPCNQYMWSNTAPYELLEYPYFTFIVRLWRIIQHLVE